MTTKNELMTMEIAALGETGLGLTQEEIAEELGGDIPQYPRIKIPAGGGIAFEIPGEDPENPEIEKEIIGVVVWHHKSNAYWAVSSDDNTPPDCLSHDGVQGIGSPGGSCKECPLNAFGSGEGGKGKACKNMELLYILQPENLLPVVVSLPPTSLNNWRTYKTLLISRGKKVNAVVTKITLSKKNTGGNDYSVANFKIAGNLNPETVGAATIYRQSIKDMLAQQAAEAMVQAESAPIDADFTEIPDDEVPFK
ncbi:hypothetical protein [Eubacterium callanderi]|uniref:hypothetical protein n=1 Tax=Eubacterium callanderi TaxID=53442 RepID=UPI001D1411A4|nr:hypothetical protein [Eubacterium callanderi]MCC3399702.1 hypothetical protein [Eubacterium callanderi]